MVSRKQTMPQRRRLPTKRVDRAGLSFTISKMKRRIKEISLWVLPKMFLSLLLSEWVLQSPAHSRTHPICFCLGYASWQLGYFGDCFLLYHLFCIFLHLNMVRISCQSTMEPLSNLHMCLLQLYLSRLRFSQLAQCSLEEQQVRHPPSPCCQAPVLSPAWEQPQSDTPVFACTPKQLQMSWQAPGNHSPPGQTGAPG